MQKALLKGMAGQVSQAGARRERASKVQGGYPNTNGKESVAATDLFGRIGRDSRRQAVHKKGRDRDLGQLPSMEAL